MVDLEEPEAAVDLANGLLQGKERGAPCPVPPALLCHVPTPQQAPFWNHIGALEGGQERKPNYTSLTL